MAQVDAGYAAYLKSPARYAAAIVAGAFGEWGDKALPSTIVSGIGAQADAQAEAVRQAQFLGGPLARDRHVVKGLRSDLIGRLIVLKGNRLGYEGAGAYAFVVGAEEKTDSLTTVLTVLKRLYT